MRRSLLPLILLVLSAACGTGNDPSIDGATDASEGAQLFNTNCALCHGRKGDLGMSGAKDLVRSSLTRDQVLAVITNGRGAMMPYKNVLDARQLEVVADHVLGLRVPAAR